MYWQVFEAWSFLGDVSKRYSCNDNPEMDSDSSLPFGGATSNVFVEAVWLVFTPVCSSPCARIQLTRAGKKGTRKLTINIVGRDCSTKGFRADHCSFITYLNLSTP